METNKQICGAKLPFFPCIPPNPPPYRFAGFVVQTWPASSPGHSYAAIYIYYALSDRKGTAKKKQKTAQRQTRGKANAKQTQSEGKTKTKQWQSKGKSKVKPRSAKTIQGENPKQLEKHLAPPCAILGQS